MKEFIVIKESNRAAGMVAEMCNVNKDNVIEIKGSSTHSDFMLMVCDKFGQKSVLDAMMDENEGEDWFINKLIDHLEWQEEYYCIKQGSSAWEIEKKLGSDDLLVVDLYSDKTLYGRPGANDLAAYIMANENKISITDLGKIGEYLKSIVNN